MTNITLHGKFMKKDENQEVLVRMSIENDEN